MDGWSFQFNSEIPSSGNHVPYNATNWMHIGFGLCIRQFIQAMVLKLYLEIPHEKIDSRIISPCGIMPV